MGNMKEGSPACKSHGPNNQTALGYLRTPELMQEYQRPI